MAADYNDSLVLVDFVNHSVGKALRITPTNVFARMPTAVKQRIYREVVEHRQDFFDKAITTTFAAAVIPRAISIMSFSASGREKTCHFIA